jgi:DNA-binding transcriptional LysR family regulator
MDLGALRIFKTVVEQGGVNRAAAKLHRVPSNVTTRVKQLEERLGARLFLREGRRLVLSPQGKVLLAYADRLLRLSAEAEGALRDGKPSGSLRIGALESTAAARLPPLLSRYHREYPGVSLELVTGTSGALLSRVRERDIEAAFVAEPFNDEGFESQAAFTEQLALIAPRSVGRIRAPAHLRDRAIVGFAAGCSYRRRLESWLQSAGVLPERVMELQSYHAIVACVAAGSGIAIVPRSIIDITPGGREVAVSPLPKALARSRTHLIWHPERRTTALDALRALLKA